VKATSFFSHLRALTAKSLITLVHKASRFSARAVLAVSIAVLLAAASAPTAAAQTVTYTGAAVNFGSANVCPSGKTTPAPCSQTVTLTYDITSSGTLGTPHALTTGAPNLDYKLASGSTCTGSVTRGNTCKVNVTFAPNVPGQPNGAVEVVDGSGNVLSSVDIYGTGTFHWALSWMDRKKVQEALPLFQRAADLKPEDVRAHHNLAECYRHLKMGREWQAEMKKILVLEPSWWQKLPENFKRALQGVI
jgi:hypothetical protein